MFKYDFCTINKNEIDTMQKIKTFLFITLAFSLAMGCKKTIIQEDAVAASRAFSSLNVNSSFNWSSTKLVTVNVQGLTTTNPVLGTLSLRTTDGRGVFYMGSHQLSQDLVLRITVSSTQDSLRLQFGNIQKRYAIAGSSITVNYLPTIEPDAP
jgi:hypothetical protein